LVRHPEGGPRATHVPAQGSGVRVALDIRPHALGAAARDERQDQGLLRPLRPVLEQEAITAKIAENAKLFLIENLRALRELRGWKNGGALRCISRGGLVFGPPGVCGSLGARLACALHCARACRVSSNAARGPSPTWSCSRRC